MCVPRRELQTNKVLYTNIFFKFEVWLEIFSNFALKNVGTITSWFDSKFIRQMKVEYLIWNGMFYHPITLLSKKIRNPDKKFNSFDYAYIIANAYLHYAFT